MTICNACQKNLPIDAQFCPHCGSRSQPSACACGAALRSGALFCTQCGKPAPGAASAAPVQPPAAVATPAMPAMAPPPPIAPGMTPPLPPISSMAAQVPGNLPPPATPWEFQAKLKPTADSLVQSLHGIFPANTPAGRIAERCLLYTSPSPRDS